MNESEIYAKAMASLSFENIKIESDGTAKGTTILLNGKPIKDLGSISFNFWNDGLPKPVSLNFSTRDAEAKPGSLVQYSSFSLNPPAEDSADASKQQAKGSFKPLSYTPPELRHRDPAAAGRALYRQI